MSRAGAWVVLGLLSGGAALGAQAPTPLGQLQAEATAHNPALQAAEQDWRAAEAAVAPAGTLPDPHFQLQQMSVGSPLPLDGLSRDVMAYVGVGGSQEFPYPGKLGLRKAVATHHADALNHTHEQQARALRRQVAEAYYQLAAARALADVLDRQRTLLGQAEKLAELRYRTNRVPQTEVLSAQLAETQLLPEVEMNAADQEEAQVSLRALLGRSAAAPAIVPEGLRQTSLGIGEARLQADLQRTDAALAAQQAAVAGAGAGLALARKNGEPDITVGFQYAHTGGAFPERYMWSLEVPLPFLHRAGRLAPERRQAAADQAAAEAQLRALQLDQRARLSTALLTARTAERVLGIVRDGALPQARAAEQAAITAYGNGNADLQAYLNAQAAVLGLEREYWQTLARHETALATVTELTGVEHD